MIPEEQIRLAKAIFDILDGNYDTYLADSKNLTLGVDSEINCIEFAGQILHKMENKDG